MIKVANSFSYNKTVVPLVICPCPCAIYMYKIVYSLNFSETIAPVFFKLYEEPCDKGGLKIYTNGLGPLSEMAAMPICLKHLKFFFFSRAKKALRLNLGT